MAKHNNENVPESPAPSPRENLSRLMDGDLGEFEMRRLLAEVEQDPDEPLATWHRYHAVRAVLRGEAAQVDTGLVAAVRDAIEAEPAHDTPLPEPVAPVQRSGWGGFAVAASVMLAVVLLVRVIDSNQSGEVPVVATAPVAGQEAPGGRPGLAQPGHLARAPVSAERGAAIEEGPVEIIRASGIERVREDRRPQPNLYLVRHAEFSTFAGSGAMMPYARVTTSDAAD